MRKSIFLALVAGLTLIASQAYAGRLVDSAMGAGAGAVVGGPVGAVAGGIIGYTAGPQISCGLRGGCGHRRYHHYHHYHD